MGKTMGSHALLLLLLTQGVLLFFSSSASEQQYISIVGDPGMVGDGLRVALEGWNFCNEVGSEAPEMGSPRAADCFDFTGGSLSHKVTEDVNKLGVGTPFPGLSKEALANPDLYAVQKEDYLGSLCEVADSPNPWQFWMVMLKNGNFDTRSGLCPQNGQKVGPFPPSGRFPCFGQGCMNQPLLYHQQTNLSGDGVMRGGFQGTYDLDADPRVGVNGNSSFFEVTWEKKAGEGGWVFYHKVKTTKKYPWLMLYLRADATRGFSGGYHYDTRGMLKTLPESPNFKVRLHLDIKQGGGPKSQFYLLDIGSCWKNNGAPCDGDVLTDVTRYSEMIINPDTPAWCNPSSLQNCPPFHIDPQNRKIYRNDTANFPYSAYHYYCAPGNAEHLEKPFSLCDPYSNPQAQELVQILPHPIWAEYGYPYKAGEGWIGDPRTWELDVGGLSSRLYFYQDPGTPPAKRTWTSIDVGTEIFISGKDEIAEWTLSAFDVLVAPSMSKNSHFGFPSNTLPKGIK
uniref:ATP synthase subunit delta, chloroplastic n=1 Tax=Anthurium amnicola TaxID=1678845 RepID=A0A1D1YFW0_9ARAE